jgi:hypothetical protein
MMIDKSKITSEFASLTIGMLEYWNDGILGSGKMGKWDIGNISLDRK